MFATDRDLLVIEPNLFRDLFWVGQRLTRGVGSVSGTTLTIASPEVAFDAANVGAGHVVCVNGVSYEVTARLSATQLTISRVRAEGSTANVPPTAATNVECWVATFAPQIEMTHRQVVRMAGVAPGAGPYPQGEIGEGAITNASELVRLEALGALSLIYTAASAGAAMDSPASRRASLYRRLFGEERGRVRVEVDTNGDGVADAVRGLHVVVVGRG
jgi:hypothetical protein